MKKRTLSLLALAGILLLCIPLHAQPETYQIRKGAEATQARFLGKTAPLREIATRKQIMTDQRSKAKDTYSNEMPNFGDGTKMATPFAAEAKPQNGDPLVFQDPDKVLQITEPNLVIEGMDASDSGVFPPDPNGDIGLNYYMQMINAGGGAMISIFDKETGDVVVEPMLLSMLWEDLSTTGFGDGIVLFDQETERWMLAEFGPLGTTVILMAISETSDPLGSYYAYEFQTPNFPDYPKFGIWNNAIMFTTNEFEEDIPVYLVERDPMINGEPVADVQRLPALPKFGSSVFAFQVAAPVDWDGNLPPPAGAPQYVVRLYDDAWSGGSDALEVWEILVDWDDPDNTSVAGPIVLPTEPFDSDVCNGGIFDCIEQFGSTTNLSAIMQVIMNRPQYRNFGNYESIVLNHTVDIDGNNQAGIRWYELRKSGNDPWAIHQQGTVSPDTDNRFMGSIAQDGSGNMLMAYSITSAEKELSLRYTGRLAGDPLGEMTLEEFEFGTGLSSWGGVRWGDYASMNVDPLDDRTFWFTGEYMKSNEWGTKIFNMQLRRDSNDIGPQARVLPQNSQFLGDAEPVAVAVRNFGWLPSQDFTISYQFDNGPLITETVTDTIIQPDSIYVHTFAGTIDVSEIGDYPLTFISSMPTDTLFSNDTLRTIVSKLTRFDAGISNVNGLDIPICESDFAAEVILTNYGQDTLTSADIIFTLNGGPDNVVNWTGMLPFGQSEAVLITSTEALLDGDNELVVYTQLPNGMPDEDVTNDTLTRTFQYIEEGVGVRLELLTDNYPTETSWELYDGSGNLLFSGGGYTQAQTLYIENWCLPEGCYEFVIYDTFGDGIEFGGVTGDYKIIRDDNGEILTEVINPSFGFQENNSFCTEVVCLLEGIATIANESSPGANDGSILIEAQNGTPPFEYSIDGGQSFVTEALFEGLPGGQYDIVIIDADGCEADFSVEVGTCALLVSAATTDASNSNSTDGTITITAINGTPPYSYSIDGTNFDSNPAFSGLPAGVYTAYVTDAVGCTNELEVTIESVVSTGAAFFGYDLQIFPNPTPNVLTIELSGLAGEQLLWFEVFDLSGRSVKTGRLVNYSGVLTGQISLQELAAGQYYLRFNHPEFRQLVKVQKI